MYLGQGFTQDFLLAEETKHLVIQCVEYTAPRGGLGAGSPRKFLKFRSSEVACGAPKGW